MRMIPSSGMTYVISDVHLGVGGAQKAAFEKVCGNIRKGDTLILLGDILDFWVDRPMALLEQVMPEYERLVDTVRNLSKAEVKIYYVPGNHDSFVFDAESFKAGTAPREVQERIQQSWALQGLLKELQRNNSLATACSVHYPYLYLTIAGRKFIFTHGHYHEWLWRLLNGVPTLPGGLPPTILSWVSAAAHSLSPLLRHALRKAKGGNQDPKSYYDEVNGAQVATVVVTNNVLRTFEAPARIVDNKAMQGDLLVPVCRHLDRIARDENVWEAARILDRARVEHDLEFLREKNIEVEVKALMAGILAAQEWRQDGSMETVSEKIKAQLEKHSDHVNHHFGDKGDGRVLPAEKFGNMTNFDTLIIGHRHQPYLDRKRNQFHDNGAMLKEDEISVTTSLEIDNSNGAVDWNDILP